MTCDAVILAGGYSSRAKTNKMALMINQQSILSLNIEAFYPFCKRIVVVGGHHFEETKRLVREYDKVKLVKNENYDRGMFSSVKRGVAEMENDFFLTPGDYPMIHSSTCEKLKRGTGDIVIPTYNGRKGHPIFIKKKLIAALIKEPVSSNLKVFRDRQNLSCISVEDEGILYDVDTINDYMIIKKRVERRVLTSEYKNLP
ncbi:nucleotidyltransferase family protein [Vallitalea okinawensis]|uniref:nucleotidyltransferase family protein n=1 Tax=Vallitalea okinawensis TaxID=2078660 RepID=UPI000CFA8AD4|nr:nucleotidyltransferase family protein [Vallitalea okinawensis]